MSADFVPSTLFHSRAHTSTHKSAPVKVKSLLYAGMINFMLDCHYLMMDAAP